MKRIIVCCIAFVSLIHCSLKAQTQDTLYKIATWKGFAQSAVSYTWDDNTAKQLTDALPLFDRYGFNVTFFVITNNNPDWTGFKNAQMKGHEVASHTLTHTSLATLADSLQEKEQKNSQTEINNQLANKQCLTLAYPYCASGNKSITQKYYISARGCSGQIENKTPADFLNVSSIICGTQGSVSAALDFNSRVNQAVSIEGWAVFLLHGINNDGGYSPVDSLELKQHLEYMSHNRDKFWIATYGNVVRYIRERDGSVVIESAHTDSLITFSVTHQLDTSIYNFPLTIKRPFPDGWQYVSVSQGGKPVDITLTEENGKKYMHMNIVPNAGNILIKRETISGMTDYSLCSSVEIYPNPVKNSSTVQFELKKTALISVELFDVSGKQIWKKLPESYATGKHKISVDANNLQGTFFIVLSVDGKRETRKIVFAD